MKTAILEWNETAVKNIEQLADQIGNNLSIRLKDIVKASMGTPGFPRIRTGKLKASIRAFKLMKYLYEVSSDVFYAGYVELGTSKSAPYPYFMPNIERLKYYIISF